ncbi:hypothetical protein Peur_063602 [Populus x canadensis]|jgi:hypothetical protein
MKLSEKEEFGLSSNGPLTLSCDAELMEYAIALIKQQVACDVEMALSMSITSSRCSLYSNLHHQLTDHQLPMCSI